MRSDYGNLRRRTRDSSWQWLLMGTILGLGFALVLCVGGYALGAITFPILEDSTSTPVVRVEPNQTEEALQALAIQQTLDAAQTVPTETTESAAVAQQPEATQVEIPVDTPAPSATPSPLPNGSPTSQVETQPGNASTTPAPTQPEVVALSQEGTPIVGTPPVGSPTQALGPPGAPAIPPELDALKTELVPVTGGTFLMGTTYEEGLQALDECAIYGTTCEDPSWVQDSTPPHQVTVDSFMMETYEVTIQQYVAFLNWMGPNSHKFGCQGQPCAFTTQPGEKPDQSYIDFDGTTYSVRNAEFSASLPVTLVTWWGANEYCQTLNRRLPTEAEWERAARGSENNYLYPWGFDFDPNRAQSSFPEATGPMAVTEYPNGASPYGVFNMAGNVSEWVYDWYQVDYYNQPLTAPNPNGPISGTSKVHRGGSWDTKPLFLRSVHRMDRSPGDPTASIGFRCVADQINAPQPVAPPSETTGTTNTNPVPTLAPPPTQPPLPTATTSSEPTATLAPG